MDLALWLVRGVSPQLASLTAKYLIVDSRPSQAAYALADHLVHSDAIVQRFETWARGRLTRGFSLDEVARAVGSSKRTLARRTQGVLGKSPLSYFQSLRVERAVHLLKTTGASVDEVATRVGYADGVTLRSLLRRRLKLGIKEIRRTTDRASRRGWAGLAAFGARSVRRSSRGFLPLDPDGGGRRAWLRVDARTGSGEIPVDAAESSGGKAKLLLLVRGGDDGANDRLAARDGRMDDRVRIDAGFEKPPRVEKTGSLVADPHRDQGSGRLLDEGSPFST
jgi:AraC-like DNA-binding protein